MSPYSPGAGRQPPLLAGRDQARVLAAELLARTASFGHPGRPSLVFTGVRGTGKTVLLRHLITQAADDGFECLQLTIDRHRPLASLLAAADETSPVSHHHHRGAAPTRQALLEQLAISAQRARDDGPGLLLAIDDLQDASPDDLDTLEAITLELTGEPLVIIGAGLPQTPDRFSRAGMTAESTTFLPLAPLTWAQATAALLCPALRAQVHWHQAAAEHVLTTSAGSPYLLQLYADATWRTAAPDPGGYLPVAAAHRGVAAAEKDLHHGVFRTRWEQASAGERQYLVAMAGQLGADGTASTGQVAATLGRPVTALSYLRSRLLAKGLIQPAGHGRIAFSLPGFETFVFTNTGESR